MTRIPILFLLLIGAGLLPVYAQETPSIKVELDKKTILLGEPLQLRIEARYPVGQAGIFQMPDSLKGFEKLGDPVLDSGTADGMRTLKLLYRLTSFDSGHQVIPVFRIGEQAKTDTIGVDVVFASFNPEQPYHDIKDVADLPVAKRKTIWWIAGGALLLLMLLLYFLLRKKKPLPVPVAAPPADAYAAALRALDELERKRPASRDFYAGLTDIFRLYIDRRCGIRSLQDTTADLLRQLQKTGLPGPAYDHLSQVLLLADFVKFAKYEPVPDENGQSVAVIRQTLKEMERNYSEVNPTKISS